MGSINVFASVRRSAERTAEKTVTSLLSIAMVSVLSFPAGFAFAIPVQTTTDPATAITASDATLNGTSGTLDSDGHSFWVSLASFGTGSPSIPSGVYSTPDMGPITAGTSFSASLSTLTASGVPSNMPATTPNTTYYFAAWTHPIGGSWTPGSVLSFTTAGIAPAFTSAPVTSATMGSAYSYSITTSGTPVAAITATTTLPTGLTLTDNADGTATLSGTPTVSGVFPIGLHAASSAGADDQSFVLTIVDPCDGWTLEGCATGSVNGKDHWKATGPFDQGVVDNTYGFPSFGAKTFRISNAVTSGSFGDQTFVKPAANEAGETDASDHGSPVGTRVNHFVQQFDIAAASPSQQAGLSISVSPDRGDGSRMSYLRFDDAAAGIDVTFYDTPGIGNPASFTPTVVATGLDRAVPHTVKFDMTFVDGPDNDIVKIYIDGTLVHTGTTWENYYRFDSESSAEQAPRAISTLIIRAGGSAVPATSGAGFLFDNFSFTTDTVTIPSSLSESTTVVKVADLDPGPNATALTNGSGKWFMYNDSTDEIDNALGFAQVGPGAPVLGAGSFGFLLGSAPNDRKNIATYAYSGTPLSEITELSYSAYSHAGIAGPTESPYFVMNVDFTGNSGAWQKRLVYVPANNGPVAQDTWNTFDMINGGAAQWVYSGATWPATLVGPDAGVTEAGTAARSWSDIRADYPSIRVLPTGGLVGVRVGEPGPDGYQGDVDAIVVKTDDGTTAAKKTFDFEPTLVSDLAVTKSVDKTTAAVGDTLTYTITVTNTEGDDAYGVSVTDLLPPTLSFVATSSADTVGTYAPGTGIWSVGALALGASATLHISATVGSGAEGTTVTNTATVDDAYSTDPDSSDDTATALTSVPAPVSGGGSTTAGGGNGPIAGSFGSGFVGGAVLGASTSTQGSTGQAESRACGPYITSFLRFGGANDAAQVRRLQQVLTLDGETVAETGIFDRATLGAVKAFQTKYATRILAPWGLTQPTGTVYLTTRKVLNEIHCNGAAFPLSRAEQQQIDAYRAGLSGGQGGSQGSQGAQGGTGGTPPAPVGGAGTEQQGTTTQPEAKAGAAGATGSSTGSSSRGFWGFLRGLFGR